MEEIWGYFLLSLFYLTLTSGLAPGPNVSVNGNPPAAIPHHVNSSRTAASSAVGLIEEDGRRSPSSNLPLPSSTSTSTSTSTPTSAATEPTMTTPVDRMILDEPSSTSPPPQGTKTDSNNNNSTKSKSESEHENQSEQEERQEENGNQQHQHHSNKTDTPFNAPLVQNTTKVQLRGKCMNTSQCFGDFVECRNTLCKCQPGYLPRIDNGDLCGEASLYHVEIPQADPTMIGVVIGLCLMSVTLCVVLRLFAKARFRENRTIFNTPNPRLMNVSLLKGSKTLLRGNSAPRSRRGSTASARSGMAEPGTPTSPLADLHGLSHDNGNAIPLAGSSSRPSKPMRQISTDTAGGGGGGGGESTPSMARPASAVNKQKYRQDSVASNV